MRNEHTPRGRYTRRLFLSAGLALALYAWAARADLAARFAAEDRLLSSVAPPPPPGDAWPLLGPRLQPAMPAARNGTLVLYVYHHTRGPEHAARAALFVRAALQDGDGVAARLLVPRGTRHLLAPRLAPLPRNASWVELPEGACQASTWGVLGAALPLLASDLAASTYVVVVDSGTAGPFLPAHLRAHLHWTEPLLARLSERVRMVGPAISCEGTPRGGDVAGDWRRQPHLPAHAWATDAQGWALLSRPQAGVMACHADPWDVRWHSDLGAAAALFDAGHTIDCLMPRYQGVDWRDERNWACNDRLPPDRQRSNDGLSVTPYEVMFWPFSLAQAESYVDPDITSNEYLGRAVGKLQVLELEWSVRGELALPLQTTMGGLVGDPCFDHDSYAADPALAALRSSCFMGACGFSMFDHYMLHYRAAAHGELDLLPDAAALWRHYVVHGQHEGRPVRWLCGGAMPEPRRGADNATAAALQAERRKALDALPLAIRGGRGLSAGAVAVEDGAAAQAGAGGGAAAVVDAAAAGGAAAAARKAAAAAAGNAAGNAAIGMAAAEDAAAADGMAAANTKAAAGTQAAAGGDAVGKSAEAATSVAVAGNEAVATKGAAGAAASGRLLDTRRQ
ncbi:hypothetical protein F751_1972 [Auxenochlorella protothecoides]|uniref:Uncharacterized protein n=1 Tax=Auxenochlorella protothecoides TaxID=3075 RepID=A0A087SH89_AUXPR|nr:hypothetical protein F751_1972 [Auxenochlorella protothecoides]KFM25093.1 hypothetical protein F751_1972 [Auxenochlorella protothecoides]